MLRRRFAQITVLVACLGSTGCDEDDMMGDDAADATTGGGMDEVSLTDEGMPLILANCGGCHTRTDSPFPTAVANMVYLEEKGDVLGLVGSFITAGDSANSGLIAIMRQEMPVGAGPTLMPPPTAGPAMAAEDVDAIALWIDQGAQDN